MRTYNHYIVLSSVNIFYSPFYQTEEAKKFNRQRMIEDSNIEIYQYLVKEHFEKDGIEVLKIYPISLFFIYNFRQTNYPCYETYYVYKVKTVSKRLHLIWKLLQTSNNISVYNSLDLAYRVFEDRYTDKNFSKIYSMEWFWCSIKFSIIRNVKDKFRKIAIGNNE